MLEHAAGRMPTLPIWVRVIITIWFFASIPFSLLPQLRASVPPVVAVILAAPYVAIALAAAGYMLLDWAIFLGKIAWWPVKNLRERNTGS